MALNPTQNFSNLVFTEFRNNFLLELENGELNRIKQENNEALALNLVGLEIGRLGDFFERALNAPADAKRAAGDVFNLKTRGLSLWLQEAQANAANPLPGKIAELETQALPLIQQITGKAPHDVNVRWRPGNQPTHTDKLLTLIFDRSIRQNSHALVKAAQEVDRTLTNPYPLWKRVCYITLPEIGSTIFNSPLIKLALSIALFIQTSIVFYTAYEAIAQIGAARLIPLIINHTPLAVIRACNALASRVALLFEWFSHTLFERQLLFIGACALVRSIVVKRLPRIPVITYAFESINLSTIFWSIILAPLEITVFFFRKGLKIASLGWNLSSSIGQFCKDVARHNKQTYVALSKANTEVVWKRIFQPQLAA